MVKKGQKHSLEARKKISEANSKRIRTVESKKKTSDSMKSRWKDPKYRFAELKVLQSTVHREKLSLIKKEQYAKSPMKEETKEKISDANTGKIRVDQRGENNPTKRPEVAEKISKALTGRKQSESHILKKSGSNSPHWNNGSSFGSYCLKFNNKFKEYIRNKFNRTCYLCSMNEHDNKEKLAVHHIDYNKNSICNGKEWAFVPLCRSCHSKTNHNKWYWFNLLINYWIDNSEIVLDQNI